MLCAQCCGSVCRWGVWETVERKCDAAFCHALIVSCHCDGRGVCGHPREGELALPLRLGWEHSSTCGPGELGISRISFFDHPPRVFSLRASLREHISGKGETEVVVAGCCRFLNVVFEAPWQFLLR